MTTSTEKAHLPTYDAIRKRILNRTLSRLTIGWFDHCSDSHCQQVVSAKAYRLYLRVTHRERITFRKAMWG